MLSDETIPKWEIGENLTLDIYPAIGSDRLMISLTEKESESSYSESVKRDCWMDGDVRGDIADRLTRKFTTIYQGVTNGPTLISEEEIEKEIEIVLNEAVANQEAVKKKLCYSERIRRKFKTERVLVSRTKGEPTWIVEIAPPIDSPVEESQFFGLTPEAFFGNGAEAFTKTFLEVFLVEPTSHLDPDIGSSKWRRIAKNWNHISEFHDSIDIKRILPHEDKIHEVSLRRD